MKARTVLLIGAAMLQATEISAQSRTPASKPPVAPPATTPIASPVVAEVYTDTLGQAIADAYANNPRLQAQRAQLRSLDETVIQAAAPYRLSAGVIGQLNYQEGPSRDFFGQVFIGRNRNFAGAVSLSQILSNGGRTAAQVSAAEADVLAGREQLREAENQILLEVVDSYVSVRRDQEIVAIQQRSVDSYTRQVDQAVARERGGDLTRTDIAQAQSQLSIARASLTAAQATLEQSRARFAAAVGRNPGTLAPEPALPGLPISLDSAYQLAERESPALWSAIMSQRAGKQRVAAQRAERNPILSASGQVGVTTLDTLRTSDLRRQITGGLTLTIPLLTQGVVDSRVRQAIADEQRLGFLVEDTRRQVDVQLQAAWNASVSAREQLESGETAVQAGQAALEGVRRGFAEGFRSNFEVLDSEQRLLNAQLIVANARYLRYAGQANLLAFMGRLEAAALEQATQQYDPERNLRRQRARQFGPFQVILKPIDELQRPSSRTPEAPAVPVATDATIEPAGTPPPAGDFGTTLPVDPSGRTPAYDGPPPTHGGTPIAAPTPAPAH